jgi:hypothetical protein
VIEPVTHLDDPRVADYVHVGEPAWLLLRGLRWPHLAANLLDHAFGAAHVAGKLENRGGDDRDE